MFNFFKLVSFCRLGNFLSSKQSLKSSSCKATMAPIPLGQLHNRWHPPRSRNCKLFVSQLIKPELVSTPLPKRNAASLNKLSLLRSGNLFSFSLESNPKIRTSVSNPISSMHGDLLGMLSHLRNKRLLSRPSPRISTGDVHEMISRLFNLVSGLKSRLT
ncbi:hypothetical protein KC19_4G167700 [Ceratodon purpureus]|uniref:Uncharacterized protein n=1 Tax=Ceratodon purpureus TaxID=3225 RepID=A0A8T0IBR8_CERPU|nr:hypothetical protein KC19_4G167700 [Ceratodon purpureus]